METSPKEAKLSKGNTSAAVPSVDVSDTNTKGFPTRGVDSVTSQGFIGAVGLTEPSTELIGIGTNVSGIVSVVNVRPNDHVLAGQTLVIIDDRSAKARLASAESSLNIAKRRLDEIRARIPASQARVQSFQFSVEQTTAQLQLRRDLLRRREQLARENAISQEELISARSEVEIGVAQQQQAISQLSEARTELSLLQPSIESEFGILQDVQLGLIAEAEAIVEQRRVELALQSIIAPCDGTILQVKIRPGEFAAAQPLSEPLITMGNIDRLHVRAQIDEEEIPRFSETAKAWASPRGSGNRQIPLSFVRLEPLLIPKRALNGNVSERIDTRVLQIIYRVEQTPESLLLPGQQVDVFIEARRLE